jgi:hypothetical protein
MSVNDQDLHSDCRLFGNERQQETLASAAPGRPWRRSRHRHNMAHDAFEATFTPHPDPGLLQHPGERLTVSPLHSP